MEQERLLDRRRFLTSLAAGAAALATPFARRARGADSAVSTPNFLIILIDDMGYGDIGAFGSKLNRTPNLDRMAREGMRLTDFYAAALCTPSRAALLTGCYPIRVGMEGQPSLATGVLTPGDPHGLNPSELTIAELLKTKGYATACIGKWHLGDQPTFLPTRQGFDQYFGLPYSNDMGGEKNKKSNRPPLPLLRNETVVQAVSMTDQSNLAQWYTAEALKFIRENRERPFFVYLAHTYVHAPLSASANFAGKSGKGIFTDAVEEVDWSVGQMLDTLRQLSLDRQTLVFFASDNGAPRSHGSNAPLKGFKGSTDEGGLREPAIAWWPGRIPAGATCHELATTMDFLPTLCGLAGVETPKDRRIDGHDIWPLLSSQPGAKTPYEAFYYFAAHKLNAVRSRDWKLVVAKQETLYNLKDDIGEKKNVLKQNPDVAARLRKLIEVAQKDLLDPKNCRKNGVVENPATLLPRPRPVEDKAKKE